MRYTDFSFQPDHDDNKSMLGYVFTMNGGAIYQKSFKQHIVADSVCEAKYIAASDTAKKAIWLKKFITEPRVIFSIDGPVLLYYDSTGAIAQAKEPKSHYRTKHILRRYYLIREIMDRGDIELQKIAEKENLTDLFTKTLGIKEFDDHKWKMHIRYCLD